MKRLKVGMITFCIVLISNYLFSIYPFLYETIYLRFLFQLIRVVHDFTIGFIELPSIYLIAPLFFFYFFSGSFKSIKEFSISFLNCLLWIINLFYLLWGFNYHQESIYQLIEIDKPKIDSNYIHESFLEQTLILVELSQEKMDVPQLGVMESQIRISQEAILQSWGIPILGRVRVRKIWSGALLHFRTSGIYIPHAFEGHIDGGLYPKQLPFTLAHEMSHGYGFTDESVCNFVAYLSCFQSPDPSVRYSAELAYWRYLGSYFRYFYPDEWENVYESLPEIIREDLSQIKKHIERYKDIMPDYRDIIYDNYLKKHGVVEGIRSYNQMIVLIAAYKNKALNQSLDHQKSY